jgi:hypothetical protein
MSERLKGLAIGGTPPQVHRLIMKSNELNDFCLESIRDICNACKELKIFDISENLFLTSLKELVQIKYRYKMQF